MILRARGDKKVRHTNRAYTKRDRERGREGKGERRRRESDAISLALWIHLAKNIWLHWT